MFKTPKYAFFLALCLFSVTGCGPEVESVEPVQAALDGNFGEVFFSYAQPMSERLDDAQEVGFQVSARFVRVRDIGRRDVRSLWGEQLPQTAVPREECEQTSNEALPQHNLVLDGSLELLDAGELVLRSDDEELLVPNWSFPSVYGVVAGVLYGDEELEIGFQPGREYQLTASGSDELGAFEVNLVAPAEFESLSVAGTEVGIEPVELEADQPVEVRWEPGGASNEIVIEVSYSLFGGEQRIVCRSYDDGLEELPPAMMSTLWEPGVSDVRLTVFRIVHSTFEAEGLDDTEALFVVSVVVPVTL